MRRLRKGCAIVLAMTMTLTMALPTTVGAAKAKISSKKITMTVGQKKTLVIKKGKKKVKKVKWSSNNSNVASVKKGKVTAKSVGNATIIAKVGKKTYKCKVTVKAKSTPAIRPAEEEVTKAPETPTGSTETPTRPSGTETTTPKVTTPQETTPVVTTRDPNAFKFERDVEIETETTIKYIEFQLNKSGSGQYSEIELKELESLGCTIDKEKGIAYKNQVCEKAIYTFKQLPEIEEDIEAFFVEPEFQDDVDSQKTGELNFGGFNAMAATICAACTFKGGSNPSDPFFTNDPVRNMFEYINGPATSMNIAKAQMDNAIVSMKSAIQACGPNVYKSYFNGATPYNDYTPDKPFVLEMYKGPYIIEGTQTITGDRPTTYMILVKSGGAETQRYIDVYYSTKMKRWYSYQNQFMHVIANDFRTPEEEL